MSIILLKRGVIILNKLIIIYALFVVSLFAGYIDVDNKVKFYNLLPKSQIYIDKSKSLTIEDILKNDARFSDNDKEILKYGYSPHFHLWIKFTLHNNTKIPIDKILEYANPLTESIKFYKPDNNYLPQKEGLFHTLNDRKTLHPIFKIKLQPQETKTYYLQASSKTTTLIAKLHLYEVDSFYKKEMKNQIVMALFFGAMIILALYNLFLFLFTKDISYIFYVLYILSISFHHIIYIGILNIYMLNAISIEHLVQYATYISALPAIALAFFIKYFIQVKQYPLLNKILNIYLLAFPFLLSIFIVTDEFNKYRNIFSLLLIIYLFAVVIYAAYRRNRQAYFVLFGKFIILSVALFMYLSSVGLLDIFGAFPYYIESALIIEALVFSIALADRIRQLKLDNDDAKLKLIAQEKDEKNKLAEQVAYKTNDLKIALNEKNLLLKELNHRVKNNMQTIVSLIRLQADELEDEKLQNSFLTIENRINAMSHLHELLYKQDDISHVNAYEYFSILIDEVRDSYDANVVINLDIQTPLKMEKAIYCGLILNELISNAFKYAFANAKGEIQVKLLKKENLNKLIIQDNGIGYIKKEDSNTLGLLLVDTLVKEQLNGTIKTDSSNGVKIEISWGEDE